MTRKAARGPVVPVMCTNRHWDKALKLGLHHAIAAAVFGAIERRIRA